MRVRLKALRIAVPELPLAVEVEPEFGLGRVRGDLQLFLYTVEASILEEGLGDFRGFIEAKARELGCKVEAARWPLRAACRDVLIEADARSALEEVGIDVESLVDDEGEEVIEEAEAVAEDLGLDLEDLASTYVYAELRAATTLSSLGWLRENVGWLLQAMDTLDSRYQAKLLVGTLPKRPHVLNEIGSKYGVEVKAYGNVVTMYLSGVHVLRDPGFYKLLEKAFTKLLPWP